VNHDLPLWHRLRKTASPQNLAMVEALTQHAEGLLLLVRDTFPTYTLHDARHAENVTRLIGELLGDRVDDLTDLETAMLILAAWYHDVGMVYDKAEIAGIGQDEQFAAYLKDHPQAFVAVHENGGEPPPEVIEAYLRSCHADRVYVHLERDSLHLRWGGRIPIIKPLGELCRSHNLSVEVLRGAEFDKPVFGACDLRLCALLLRLADILDFDTSRSPDAVYTHLGLDRRATRQTAASDREWRKHLASRGFTFPAQRSTAYSLTFVAAPDRPSVEYDIRQFLDTIEDELRRGRQLLDMCSPRWRGLVLPGSVDRHNIVSDGYTYGEFRFELDRSAILDMFVGERLYEDQLTLIRELLQNAMDAVRLRIHLHGEQKAAKIEVNCWEDDAGFIWLRIDDPGIGMDEEAIHEYFLRVGRSYYRSPELAADLLRHSASGRRFGAISQFGIGVLSCFIVGDRVEVSTRRIRSDGTLATPVRLSLDRSEEFFVLRQPPMSAPDMPSRLLPDTGFRRAAGTSIAVRIDPTKADVSLAAMTERFANYVFCPPVPVLLNGQPCGEAPLELLETPLLDRPKVLDIGLPERLQEEEESYQEYGESYLAEELPYLGPLQVVLLPLDLTHESPTPDLRGQFVAVFARNPEYDPACRDLFAGWPAEALAQLPRKVREHLASCVDSYQVRFQVVASGLLLSVGRTLDEHAIDAAYDYLRRSKRSCRYPLPTLTDGQAIEFDYPSDLREVLGRVRSSGDEYNETSYSTLLTVRLSFKELLAGAPALVARLTRSRGMWWGHNGVSLPSRAAMRGDRDMNLAWAENGPANLFLAGAICFQDGLRPDVSVSRDTLRGLPFELHSTIQLAVRRATATIGRSQAKFDDALRRVANANLLRLGPTTPLLLAWFRKDPLLSDGHWSEEAVIEYPSETAGPPGDQVATFASAADLRLHVQRAGPILLRAIRFGDFGTLVGDEPALFGVTSSSRFGFSQNIFAALAQLELDLGWSAEDSYGQLWIRSGERPRLPDGLDWFPPLFFVPYIDRVKLLRARSYGPVNQSHPTARWLIANAQRLHDDLPAIFNRIGSALRPRRWAEAGRQDLFNRSLDQVPKHGLT
jgi:hypothetical protein